MQISLGFFLAIALVAVAPVLTVACSAAEPLSRTPAEAEPGAVLFIDDFEGDLGRWTFPFGSGHALVDRLDGSGRALELKTQSLPVYALIEGSEQWGDVRIEGELLFPDTTDKLARTRSAELVRA